jgi:hypothetical protein
MSLRGDDRGVVVQVGAVILFAFVILAITMYQVQVVPDQNKEIEFKHNEEVQDDIVSVRDAILSSSSTGTSPSETVKLGTTYPSRTIFVNPTPPTGRLETVGTTDRTINISIENATAINDETFDYWNGSQRNFSTGFLVYTPRYTRYDNAPETTYENSVVVNRFEDGTELPLTEQSIIDGNEITLIALNGSLKKSGSQALSVPIKPLSVSTATVSISTTESTGNLTLHLPTQLSNETWGELLESERSNGNVSSYEVNENQGRPNVLTIRLSPGEYDLKLAKIGVGSASTADTNPYYITRSGNGNPSMLADTSRTFTFEVRDRYNNPVSGVQVQLDTNATEGLSSVSSRTDDDGRASVTFEAPNIEGTYELVARIGEGDTAILNASVHISVTKPAVGEGGNNNAYNVSWAEPGKDPYTLDVAKEGNLDMAINTTPTVEDAEVDYYLDNTTIAKLSRNGGITNGSGRNETTLQPKKEGTVTVFATSGASGDRIEVQIVNLPAFSVENVVTGGRYTGDNSGVKFDLTNELGENITITGVKISPQNSNVVELDDGNQGQGGGTASPWEKEIYIETPNDEGYLSLQKNDDQTLPGDFDLDQSANLQNNETATFYFYEFLDSDGSSIDMTGESIEITITYELENGTPETYTFEINPE